MASTSTPNVGLGAAGKLQATTTTTPVTGIAAGKRPAEEPAAPPTMTKPAAAKAFVKVRPAVPKEQTLYMRFKPFLQAANPSVKGKDFTALVKVEWEKVKNTPTSLTSCSHPELLKLKKAAQDQEAAEKAAHSTALRAWATEWTVAAAAHLGWAVVDATESDYATLSTAIERTQLFSYSWPSGLERSFDDALVKAKAELAALKQAAAATRAKAVVANLDGAVACGAAKKGMPLLESALAKARSWRTEFAAMAAQPAAEVGVAVRAAVDSLAVLLADDLNAAAESAETLGAIEAAQKAAADLRTTHAADLADDSALAAAEAKAKAAHTDLRYAVQDLSLVRKLQGMDEAGLRAHAKELREKDEAMAELQAELDDFRKEKRLAELEQQRAEQAALASAATLPREVGRALQSQMVYIQGIKHRAVSISYTRGGVTKAAFAAAFSVPVGTTTASVSADSLSIRSKPLRYGAALVCGDVTLRLTGETLSASAGYGMW